MRLGTGGGGARARAREASDAAWASVLAASSVTYGYSLCYIWLQAWASVLAASSAWAAVAALAWLG